MAFHHIKPGSFTFATEPKHSRLSRRFGNHGTESPGTCQAGRGDDHMNEKEDEVAHPGHGNNALQSRLNQANLAIRHRQVGNLAIILLNLVYLCQILFLWICTLLT